eukprot:TRINITY_DN758_c0_g1_i2.p1 TRINITY_DN758_c0_g1~~TRINITY_DN758_c0_g1_i2.p1  ORF type:complete len:518 (+),score=70.79 TRINITY_DN758_c0_g1_i2:261-1814(+)
MGINGEETNGDQPNNSNNSNVAAHREDSIVIPFQGSDEKFEVNFADLPEDADDMLDIMMAGCVPFNILSKVAIGYYKMGKMDQFLHMLKQGTDPQTEDFYPESERAAFSNALSNYYDQLGPKEREEREKKKSNYLNARKKALDTHSVFPPFFSPKSNQRDQTVICHKRKATDQVENSFIDLPLELIENILKWVPIEDFETLLRVCKVWLNVFHDERFNLCYFDHQLGDIRTPFRAHIVGENKNIVMPKPDSFFWRLRREALALRKSDLIHGVMLCCIKGYYVPLRNVLSDKQAIEYFGFGNQRYPLLTKALEIACTRGHVKVVEVLLDIGMDIETGYQTKTPLTMAISARQASVVKLLLKRGATMGVRGCDNMWSPLHTAVLYDQLEIMKILLGCRDGDESCNGNHTRDNDSASKLIGLREGRYGQTALHISAERGHEKILSVLLDHGADVDATNGNNWTPLHIACSKGHRSVVEVLLSRGANRTKLVENFTPLNLAIEYGHGLDIEPLFVNIPQDQ